jgi:hypothetical protein
MSKKRRDRKNDGYIKSKGIFFQVFSPEEITKSYHNVVKKLNTDFKKVFCQYFQWRESIKPQQIKTTI